MKKQLTIVCLALSIICCDTACNKWLDVKPSSQVSEEDQFSSEAGFKESLTGVYQLLSQPALYGRDLSFGFVDVLGQNYTNTTTVGHESFTAATYNYTDAAVQIKIDSIWRRQYAAIAQINYILKNVDARKSVFAGINYQVVKGEALALRAFLHFDLLRLFGPNAVVNAGSAAIPYMKQFTVQPQSRLSAKAVLDACVEDLKAAEALLVVVDKDTLLQAVTGGDNFLGYRRNKFNYWAVKALMARVYLYAGALTLAYQKAKEVIDSRQFNFLKIDELNGVPAAIDRTGTHEHVFAIYVPNLKDLTDRPFKTGVTSNVNYSLLISASRKSELFKSTSDIRTHPVFWSDSRGIVYYSKFWQEDNNDEIFRKRIPLIKLSEMYLIAAETASTMQERLAYFNALRDARIDVLLSANTTETVLLAEIANEYRKDLIGEGQLFFFYKRNRYVNIPGAITGAMTDSKYIFPLPNQEIEFGK